MKNGTRKNRWLFILAFVPLIAWLVSGVWWGVNKFTDNKVETVYSGYKQRVIDSTQWTAIYECKENNGTTNKRIDVVDSQQKTQDSDILCVKNELQQVKKNQEEDSRVLLVILNKIDKTLIPMVRQQNADNRKLDSLSNESFLKMQFRYYDSLYVNKEPDELLINSFESEPIDNYYDQAFEKTNTCIGIKTFPPKQNPFKYLLFINN